MPLNRQQIVYEKQFNTAWGRVCLGFSEEPCITDGNTIIFGFPLNLTDLDSASLPEIARTTDGQFAIVRVSHDTVELASDTCGGFRIYYVRQNGCLYISDSWRWLIAGLDSDSISMNENEHRYWDRHGYTTGGATVFSELNKLPPATVLTVSADHARREICLDDSDNDASTATHDAAVEASLRKTCNLLTRQQHPVVLLFSGGADSCLLAALMKEARVDFVAVTLQLDPSYPENLADCRRARHMAEYLGIRLETLSVSLDDTLAQSDAILDRMLFDRHLGLLHFGGMAQIAARFGTDTVVVCGQAADSILSYGPTCQTRGDFVARLLTMGLMPVITPAAGMLVAHHDGQPLRGAITETEFYTAFFDQHYYYSVVHQDDPAEYVTYIESVVRDLMARFDSPAALMMYLKLYGFVQGSDNQVVLQATRAAGIRRVVLPFTHADIVNGTIRHRSKYFDLLVPKYPVKHLLKKLNIPLTTLPADTAADTTVIPLERVQSRMRDLYDSALAALFSGRDIRERQQ